MDGFTFVCKVTELPPGSMRTYALQDKTVALANVGGQFFAVDDTCTHEQCSLGADGALDGNVLICGCHGAMYDVTSGKVLSPPAPKDVSTYPVESKDGKVYIKI